MLRISALLSFEEPGREADAPKRTFQTLDLLRGLAALAVVGLHLGTFYGKPRWLSHGYLAVDLFFALSGFILAFRYQASMDAGAPLLPFLKARLIRLYPLYLVGLGVGAGYVFAHHASTQDGPGRRIMLATLLLNLLFLPTFVPECPQKFGFWRASFPYNNPAWSLFSELVANVLHATVLRRRSNRTLLLLSACLGSGLGVAVVIHGNLNLGDTDQTTLSGLLRVGFSYTVGMLVCRLWQARPQRIRVSPLLPVALLLAVLLFPATGLPTAAMDICSVLILTPTILILAVYSDLPSRWARKSSLIGTMSYAVYAIHMPLLRLFNAGWLAVTHGAAANPGPALALYFGLLLLIAFLLDRFYDIPIRAWLREARWLPDGRVLASLVRSRYPERYV